MEYLTDICRIFYLANQGYSQSNLPQTSRGTGWRWKAREIYQIQKNIFDGVNGYTQILANFQNIRYLRANDGYQCPHKQFPTSLQQD
jgi:hypothetical protein